MKKLVMKILPNSLIKILKSLKDGNYSYFFWLFPIKKNKIVICNFYGRGYGDNGKYIAEELIRQGTQYDIVWLLRKELIGRVTLPQQIRIVEYGSPKGLFELATAKIWIDNCRKHFYPPKRKVQYYIQTWHGGISLKQIEKDAETNLDSNYIKYAKKDSIMADLFISNSTFCTNMYQSAFWYNKGILECGSPRCDALINKNNKVGEKVRDYFNLNKKTRILIYAPTFRANSNTNVYNINFERLVKVLERRFGGEWNILVRLHPNISSKDSFLEYTSKIINATNYDDMYELLAASDILITDYSSTMFEFSFAYKPVFLYAADIENYIKDRNFYFNIHSLPYPVAENNEQLFNIVEQFDSSAYLKGLDSFLSNLEIKEKGNASDQVVKKIKQITL